MVGRNHFTVAVLSVATACSFGSVATKRVAVRMGTPAVLVASSANVMTPPLRVDLKPRRRERKQTNDDLNNLQARIALLWARVEAAETKILAQREKEGKTSA